MEMLAKYQNAGVKLYISDFSLGTGIPTVGVMAYDPATFPDASEIVWTAGTTPDPQKALSRALTEVAQLAGDFNSGSNYVASGLPKFTSLEDAEYIMNPGDEIDITDLPDISNDNIKNEVQNCIAALAKNQMEVLVIDTRHTDLQIPAFYTIIPGAHFRERSLGTSVGMFATKHITENKPPREAIKELMEADAKLPGKSPGESFVRIKNKIKRHVNNPDVLIPDSQRCPGKAECPDIGERSLSGQLFENSGGVPGGIPGGL